MNLRPLFAAAALLAASGVSADVTEELNFSYPINEGGRISVDNVNGDVTVIGGSGGMVEITAIKRAGSQAYLDGLQITIRNTDDAIRIETDHPERSGMGKWFNWNEGSGSVSYTVRVPAHVNLDAIESVNGDLNISGVSGIVRASTVNGSINAADLISDAGIDTVNGAVEVSFARFGGAQKADCETVNGRLTINLPGDADARVQAETINGGIDASDFGLATNKGFVGRDLEGAIGAGSARLELSTVNGAIKVRSH
jgi:DUF4097 and DUF4098 domain-containing protein YvlB